MAARGSYAKGVAKRGEILDTALDVIAREGYHGTSVKELADAVGLSQAGVLHYFSSKDELFHEILRRRDELDRARFEPGDSISDALTRLVAHNAEVPGLVQLYVQQSASATDPNHPSHGFFVERYRALIDGFTVVLGELQDRGEITAAVDPPTLASLFAALIDGLQEQWLLDPGVDMTERMRAFWRLLAPAPAP